MLSNLHSFHFGALLQNSSALPWHVYQRTTNKLLLSPLKSTATTTEKPTRVTPAATITKPQPLKRRNTCLPKQITIKPQPKRPVQICQKNQTKPQSSNKPAPQWKPGHGVIEKVDKTTGEIMHLSVKQD